MNICYVTNLYPPLVLGGAEIIVEKAAMQVSKRGHNVIIITTSPDNDEHIMKRDNTTIYQLNTTKIYPVYKQTDASGFKKPFWHLFDLWNNDTLNRIKEILELENSQIIHINNYKGLSLSCFRAGRDLNIPVVFESHDFSLICPRANLIRGNNTLCKHRNIICNNYVNIQRKLLNDNVDLLVSPSNFMINKFKENNFFKNTKSVKIPLGIEFESHETSKDYDIIDITYIGTLGKHKGVHTLIEAFKNIKDDDIRLHIVGKGYDEEEFKSLANGDARITFHGFIDNGKISKFYEKSNVIVIPSICYDNSPLVIYESFSMATPVIGSDIGGIPELIEDNVNGYLFEAENVPSLKDKLMKIVNNKETLKELEDNSLRSLPKDSMKAMVDSLIKEYENLLN